MRRTKPDKTFKGSVFITYKTREEAENVQKVLLLLRLKGLIFFKNEEKFNDIELTKLMQDDYWAQKSRETKEKRAAEKVRHYVMVFLHFFQALKTSKNAKENKEVENAPVVNFTKGLILEVLYI